MGADQPRLLALEVDLVSEASVQAAIEQTIAAFGRIDYVVNNCLLYTSECRNALLAQ